LRQRRDRPAGAARPRRSGSQGTTGVSTDAGRAASGEPSLTDEPAVGATSEVVEPQAGATESGAGEAGATEAVATEAPEASAVEPELQISPVTTAAEADAEIAEETPGTVVQSDGPTSEAAAAEATSTEAGATDSATNESTES
jgi:hypothetical protein